MPNPNSFFFSQYPESVMFRECSDLNFKEYLDIIKEPIALDVIKEKLDRENPEMVKYLIYFDHLTSFYLFFFISTHDSMRQFPNFCTISERCSEIV